MEKKAPLTRVLLHQSIAFLVLMALSWLDELLALSQWVFNRQSFITDFRGSALKMLLILAVWLLVANSTRRILARIRYLEGFIRMCSWCHQVHYKGEWLSMEKFMEQGFDTPTTHGICPHCLAQQKAAVERARKASAERVRQAARPSNDPA
jgi:hypothetical protein